MAAKWQLNDIYKGFTRDLDKVRSPEETVRAVKMKFRELDFDILSETVRIDNGRLDIPVYFSVCGKDAKALTGTAKQMGKGATPLQAEASAVMELVERFSFYHFAGTENNFVYGTYNQLKDRALPLEQIARSVHDNTDDLDAALDIFAELPMKWARARNLTRETDMLVPFDWFFAINEFNGTSAGNCLEEALCQGICEVVERHVSAIVSAERRRVPGIDPDSAGDPIIYDLLHKYRKNGIRLYVSDFTLDTGIPTIGVMAHDPETFPDKSELVWTAGTTPNPEKALNRALTEVAQLGGDFNTGSNYVASGLPKLTDLHEADFITHPDQLNTIRDLPDLSDANIRVEIQRCIAALADRGFEVMAIDTGHPLLDVSAVYTVIPGARFRERAAAGSVGLFTAKLICDQYPPEIAVEALSDMERRLPGKYYIQFYLGQCHLALEAPETALDHFSKALDRQPHPQDIASIYSYMGQCHKELGQYRQALAVLEKGLATDSERTDIYNLAGFCHFKLREHEKAIEAFQQVLRLHPTSAIDYANIATNYREMGDTQNAIAYYRMAVKLDPGIEFAQTNLEKLTATLNSDETHKTQ
ncbi:MAG: YcaO-like family protein [Thermodesulfobacteriota bacterium]